MDTASFFAADVGNSRIKIGRFQPAGTGTAGRPGEVAMVPRSLPLPVATIQLPMLAEQDHATNEKRLRDWFAQETIGPPHPWFLASVHRNHAAWLEKVVSTHSVAGMRRLTQPDVPLEVRVESPELVGMDRLLAAAAVNRLREQDRPAIVVDVGTAITVDLVWGDGAFEGGAILPGIAMAARALHDQTDALPSIPLVNLAEPPAPVGKSTISAIESGVLWGAVGALRELIGRMAAECRVSPHVFLTGGMSSMVVSLLGSSHTSVAHFPELVLSGIALVAEQL